MIFTILIFKGDSPYDPMLKINFFSAAETPRDNCYYHIITVKTAMTNKYVEGLEMKFEVRRMLIKHITPNSEVELPQSSVGDAR